VQSSPEGALGAAALLARIRPSVARPRSVLLLDGASGSGKTTLAAWLAPRLRARVLALEDVYPGWGGLDAAAGLLAERILPARAAGDPVAWRSWDWAVMRPGPIRHLLPGARLVVEGCGALTPASRRLADLAVVLDVDEAVRRRRILERDPPEAASGHRGWAVQERRRQARDRPAALADLVLHGGVRLPGDRSGDPRNRPR